METILITGCNGFIGRNLCKFLLDKNKKVIGIDLFNKNLFKDNSNFIFYKSESKESIVYELRKYSIDVVYHLAWNGVSTSDKNNYHQQLKNIENTYEILEMAKELKVKKIVIPGSVSEFSRCTKPVTGYEEDSPADLYAATKVAVRKLTSYYCFANNIDFNWMLITSVYSSTRKDANLLNYVITNLLKDQEVLCTKLEQNWDYIYIDDLINAMYLIGEKGKKNQIYPIGSGIYHPLNYYVMNIAEYLKKEDKVKIGQLEYKNEFIDNSIVDISELKKLGYKCNCIFEDTIIKVIKEYKDGDENGNY